MKKKMTAFSASLLDQNGTIPQWVPVLPVGRTNLPDRESLVDLDDPQAVIARSGANLAVTVDHRGKDFLGRDSRAYGWITALEVQKLQGHSHLMGRVEWNKAGRELISDRQFRFFSAEVIIDQHHRVLEVTGLTLTNSPAIKMPGLFHEQSTHAKGDDTMPAPNPNPQPKGKAPESGDQDRLKTAELAKQIKELEVKLARFEQAEGNPAPAKPEADQANSAAEYANQMKALEAKLAKFEQVQAAAAARALVDPLIKAGKILPSKREWAEDYAAKDPDGFTKFAEDLPVLTLGQSLATPALQRKAVELSSDQRDRAKELSLSPAAYAQALERVGSLTLAEKRIADQLGLHYEQFAAAIKPGERTAIFAAASGQVGDLTEATTGFRAAFNLGLQQYMPTWDKIAMAVKSTGEKETHGWLQTLPGMREWLGARVVNTPDRDAYVISNRLFEGTAAVARSAFDDDAISTYRNTFAMLGMSAAAWNDDLVWPLLAGGFTTDCYDGKKFFAADHPVKDAAGTDQSVSNMQTGTETPWYLFDTSKPVKALIFQDRNPPELTARERADDPNVFDKDQFLYGVRARGNAGYGLWQMAFASKAALSKANLNKAIAAMQALKLDHGRLANITPTLLVVPPSLRATALELIKAERFDGGASNTNYNVVDVHVEGRLA